jgi:hypothetical protein
LISIHIKIGIIEAYFVFLLELLFRIIFIFLLSFYSVFKAQLNIVHNGGFEAHTGCPNGGAQWNLCVGWNNLSFTTGYGGTWGTPDYYHACGTNSYAPPATFGGTCSPHSGDAMTAMVLYNVPYPEQREYLSTKLVSRMSSGKTYTLSFWITNGTGIKSPWVIKNIGVHFSSYPLIQNGWDIINVVPQCEIQNYIASNSWVNYTFTIMPSVTYDYLTIGSFRNDSANAPMMYFANPGGNNSVYANYFIDDIEVFAPDTLVTRIADRDEEIFLGCFPNPVFNKLTMIFRNGSDANLSFELFDFNGRKFELLNQLKRKDINYVTFEVSVDNIPNGVYFLVVKTGTREQRIKIIKAN